MLKPWAYFLCGKKVKKAENSAICKIGHYLVDLEEWSPDRSLEAVKSHHNSNVRCQDMQPDNRNPLTSYYRVPWSCHAPKQWLPALTTSSLWQTVTATSYLPPQELIQPGEWSLSGEQTSAKLTLYICPIGYIYARLSHITPEVCFTGLSKQKEQNQKPNQPKNSKASYFSIFTQQI